MGKGQEVHLLSHFKMKAIQPLMREILRIIKYSMGHVPFFILMDLRRLLNIKMV